MEEVNFREIFKDTCYIPALRRMIETSGTTLSREGEKATEAFLAPLEGFIGIVMEHQDKGSIAPVKWIAISFLRTAMFAGKPVLLAEAYENFPFLERPVMGCELNAAWMFPGWDGFREELRKSIRQQSLGRYVRNPELKSYEAEAVSIVLRQLAMPLKFMIRGLESRGIGNRLADREHFVISYGEYMDWQFPLMEIKEEVDLFLCDEKEDLTFRRFQGMHYENKQFGSKVLDDCVFRDCTFQKTDFVGTKLRNVRFINCVFEDCRFEGVELMGSSVLSSRLRRACFRRCRLMEGFYQEEQNSLFYCHAEFKWSLLEEVSWQETEISDAVYVDCQLFDVGEKRE
ncbi:MAG: pentapeptide repeat-containing protein [Lachnospiraceae bacterium]|nr:pentapeptide repeat-containing protein [Lachnospiraceae bacterium]